jgi:hypothetical protein
MYEIYLCSVGSSNQKDFHGSCPSKVMTGVRIDLSAVAPGCVELDAMIAVFVASTLDVFGEFSSYPVRLGSILLDDFQVELISVSHLASCQFIHA